MNRVRRTVPPRLARRRFLQAGLSTVALPSLEAFAAPGPAPAHARTFVAVGAYLGWHAPAFFPQQTGADYSLPPLLEPLRDSVYFARFFIDAGALCWPNGLELSPDRLHEQVAALTHA